MHFYDEESAELAIAIVKYAMERVKMDPPPLDKPYTLSELQQIVGHYEGSKVRVGHASCKHQ